MHMIHCCKHVLGCTSAASAPVALSLKGLMQHAPQLNAMPCVAPQPLADCMHKSHVPAPLAQKHCNTSAYMVFISTPRLDPLQQAPRPSSPAATMSP